MVGRGKKKRKCAFEMRTGGGGRKSIEGDGDGEHASRARAKDIYFFSQPLFPPNRIKAPWTVVDRVSCRIDGSKHTD